MASLEVWGYTLLSVGIISLIALLGIIGLGFKREQLKKIMLYLVSFAAGALIGDAFIHLLPEIVAEVGFGLNISLWILGGIVVSFIIEKFVHWHHCHHEKPHIHQGPEPFAIMNIIGDSVHNFIDGVIIGASYLLSIPAGIATTVAVALHEIPQEIGDYAILIHGGFSQKKAVLINFLSSLSALLGAVLAILLGGIFVNSLEILISFAAGHFIYIASVDLIPELHKETDGKKSLLQLFAFILGIGAMILLIFIE